MFIVHPVFACIFLIWTISFISIAYYFSKRIQVLSNTFATSKTTLVGKIVDSVSNAITARAFARNAYEQEQVSIATDVTVTKDRDMQRYILRMNILFDVSIILLLSAMMFGLVYMYSKGLVTVGDFAFVISLSISMFFNLWYIASQFVQFAEHVGRCSQALTIITVPHEIVDAPDAKTLIVTSGNITFNNVTFNYKRNNNLFENKHVEISAGSKVGLVGFSGSGKTTFVNLILRFFDIESGKITIDGQDIAKVTQDSLRKQISLIPQDTSLFHRSLMENIRYGRLDATDEEVIEASKRAHCHEFISVLPEGYNALVGERGVKLSGGQRQRIAIARAMLKNALILILDEATSALDSVTEKQIQEGLHELMKGRTTIVIAHRLSTLSEMDRILVFDKGHIVEDGTHEELLKLKGHYARMWNMQAGGFLPEVEKNNDTTYP
jgi:ATP-binding cassette subfamily B protein